MSITEEKLSILVSLGFEREQAVNALESAGGNVEMAANILFESPSFLPLPGEAGETPGTAEVVQGSRSQYSVQNGRSACTCIALTAAESFLTTVNENPREIVNSAFLDSVIMNGVSRYDALHTIQASVEHMSAEEVLGTGAFPRLQLIGDIRQGILSHDRDHPVGMRAQLPHSIVQDATWTCVLFTKTPETVLICLPNGTSNHPYVLIDSHPRPQLCANEAYARFHTSMEGLLQSLEQIFPVTDLGVDVPEMMAVMYNSFDMYTLLATEQQTTRQPYH